jgi:hypothetical protein
MFGCLLMMLMLRDSIQRRLGSEMIGCAFSAMCPVARILPAMNAKHAAAGKSPYYAICIGKDSN